MNLERMDGLEECKEIEKLGQDRIRTYEGRSPPDLQSGAFDRSATYPKAPNVQNYKGKRMLVKDTMPPIGSSA